MKRRVTGFRLFIVLMLVAAFAPGLSDLARVGLALTGWGCAVLWPAR